MKNDNFIEVAKLGKVVGLKGELKLHNLSDFPEQFKKNSIFTTQTGEILSVETFNKNRSTILFAEIKDATCASKYVNQILFTTKEETKKNCFLKNDEFFWFDIIGCEVLNSEELLGSVVEIERIGTQDYLHIKTDEKLEKQGYCSSFMIPYIDRYILCVEILEKKIVTKDAKDFLEKI